MRERRGLGGMFSARNRKENHVDVLFVTTDAVSHLAYCLLAGSTNRLVFSIEN